MGALILFISVFTFSNLVLAGRHDIYAGNKVYGAKLRDESDVLLLHNLSSELDVDVWAHGVPNKRDAVVMVTPENRSKFLETLDQNGIEYYVHLSDVVSALEEHDRQIASWKLRRTVLAPHEHYARYDEVDEYLETVAAEHPDIVTLVTAAPSFEGRAIKYLKISTNNFSDNTKPVYFLSAAMHSREWVTTPLALYTIHRLVENLREEDRDLLENVDWIILPIINPDGYEYSHTDNRLWRRTRSYNPAVSTTCYGVDPNRNFDINFNTEGVSTNPCSDIYPGLEPFSEPETRNVRDIMFENLDRLQIYMDIHSYGNYVLFAYGNTTLPPNAPQLHHVASAIGEAIDAKKLDKALYYLVGNGNLVLYPSSGTSDDYGQSVGIPFSYTLELPGYEYDFRVPPEYIEQINTESFDGIAASARLAAIYYRARTT